ncbi:hypothetical protein DS2_09087 [Catenovulum agarivorans DS-2]|uniref:N-acetyltransferase domain-containing protein n=1 Tax=Catenovulum agarivorans DS-2 TaxID=1328313 RepID=W7QE93_9ALTE|nr:GNAT family N-acetyltransferase [Catenovulum agarivorans]EWH10241.1 hypothetical protein DS2_09087 [Catenovulum agarivorans DS-2]
MKSRYANNISNMLKLWHLYGASKRQNYWYSNSWPNRVWSDSLGSQDHHIDAIKHDLSPNQKLVVSTPLSKDYILSRRLSLVSKLQLMDLKLNDYCLPNDDIAVGELTFIDDFNKNLVEEFVKICSTGFGYSIDPQVLLKVVKSTEVELALLTVNSCYVATVLLHSTADTLGIYQLTVPQTYRGLGFANSLMLHALNYAKSMGYQYVSLQASDMAKKLYQRIGFTVSGEIIMYRTIQQGE